MVQDLGLRVGSTRVQDLGLRVWGCCFGVVFLWFRDFLRAFAQLQNVVIPKLLRGGSLYMLITRVTTVTTGYDLCRVLQTLRYKLPMRLHTKY